MIRATATILRICFYGAILLVGVDFAVKNRTRIDLTFYPFPYALSMPLFLFGIGVFALGVLIGWMLSRLRTGGFRRAHKQAMKRSQALENELASLRSEHLIRPVTAAALPQK